MPQALSSFLVSVSIIVAMVWLVPCIESLVRLLRRRTRGGSTMAQPESAKVFSREAA